MKMSATAAHRTLAGILQVAAFLVISTIRSPAAPAVEMSREAAATVVVYNRSDPASRDLAKYYAERRGIPFSQVLGLECPPEEEISRDQYLVRIEAPIRDAFTKRGWWTIERNADGQRFVARANKRFVALIRGVPLKIRPDEKTANRAPPRDVPPGSSLATLLSHNEASVDSELAALFSLLNDYPALLNNPYFRRFTRIFDVPPSQGPLLVCRLDGPSDADVRRMIDDGIATERSGLWGWACIDARNIQDGEYKEGDDWMREVAALMRRQGIPVLFDNAPEVLPAGFPLTDTAIYYGWYAGSVTGPFSDAGFRFVPGAVAVHLHSFSAVTIRDASQAWVAPLLAAGATASAGNVYEPYLSLTLNLSVFQDRLMSGFTLAEAAYTAHRGLSWMGIIVGDPLYRPYASWHNARTEPGPESPWREYRRAVLAAGGSPVAAAARLRDLAVESGNSMFLEALGQAQAAEGDVTAGLETLDEAFAMEKSRSIRFRIALSQIEFLRRTSDRDAVRAKLTAVRADFRNPSDLATLAGIAAIIDPPTLP